MQHKVLGGVCAGLANYFGIDAVIARVLFVLAFMAFSAGFWLYIILWIVMPEGKPEEAPSYIVTEDGQALPETTSRKSSMTAGLILILAGCCFLLGNLVPRFTWRTFWPIVLIGLGLLLIVPLKDKKS